MGRWKASRGGGAADGSAKSSSSSAAAGGAAAAAAAAASPTIPEDCTHGCEHAKVFKTSGSAAGSDEEPAGEAQSIVAPENTPWVYTPCSVRALDKLTKVFRFLYQRGHGPPLTCSECPTATGWQGHLLLCLDCVYIGCMNPDLRHFQQHADATGHALAVDIEFFQVFCTICGDYVYDPDIERISQYERGLAVESKLPFDASRTPYRPWQPQTDSEREMLAQAQKQGGIVSSAYCSGLGLRGMSNLGNTCFGSCVLQALVHNPLLRNYFLGGQHRKSARCQGLRAPEPVAEYKEEDRVQARWKQGSRYYPGKIIKKNPDGTMNILYDDGDIEFNIQDKFVRPIDGSTRDTAKSITPAVPAVGEPDICLACAMNNVFHEMYSGERRQFAPYRLLHIIWQHSRHLAGYAQQDAHEFFIALLDGLHTHCGGTQSLRSCDCIIHRIFTGGLQSDVICTKCSTVSSTVDPFWDISLDISSVWKSKLEANMELLGSEQLAAQALMSDPVTLQDCIDRFTHAEQLSAEIDCRRCGGRQRCEKQLSMRKLPVVICFHLKRFEHEVHARKIDLPVRFPETLDMRPYLAHSIGQSNGKERAGARAPDAALDDGYMYSLFAVINHHGNMQQGHYTCFVKLAHQGGQWFNCDDEMITTADARQVQDSEAYMLFYIKSRLEYVR